jgi:hypothetical protein
MAQTILASWGKLLLVSLRAATMAQAQAGKANKLKAFV